MAKVWAATGHRPNKLGGYVSNPLQREIRRIIKTILIQEQPRGLISGMALGVDQWWAHEAVMQGIPFVAAIPFIGQERAWPKESIKAYEWLMLRAAKVVVVSPGSYTPEKMQIRNKWMVDKCDVLLAVWDGSPGGTGNCVRYANQVGREIHRLDPTKLRA